jgi:endonuclease/exonuclease/phosphatase family metal-dependent hydrolase
LAQSEPLRVLSYNVHRCIGGDGRLAPARIARVIARFDAHVVALQELDAGHHRTEYADQPALLAEMLQMGYLFFPALERTGPNHPEHYGDAILSRQPLTLVRAGRLPTLADRPDLELRGALWATIGWQGQTVHIVNTHLGINRRERIRQIDALLGPEWVGHPQCARPRIVCGDFNAWPGSYAYARLRRALRDAQVGRAGTRPRTTFPSRWPVLRIDHVFVSADVVVRRTQVPRTPLTRLASDHLPLLVEVSLP